MSEYIMFFEGDITHLDKWPGSKNLPLGAWLYMLKPHPSNSNSRWFTIVMTTTGIQTWQHHPDESAPKEFRMYVLVANP